MPIEKELHWTSEIMQARRVEGHISCGVFGETANLGTLIQ